MIPGVQTKFKISAFLYIFPDYNKFYLCIYWYIYIYPCIYVFVYVYI